MSSLCRCRRRLLQAFCLCNYLSWELSMRALSVVSRWFAFCVREASGPDAAGQTVHVDYTKFTNNSFRLNSDKPLWPNTHTHTSDGRIGHVRLNSIPLRSSDLLRGQAPPSAKKRWWWPERVWEDTARSDKKLGRVDSDDNFKLPPAHVGCSLIGFWQLWFHQGCKFEGILRVFSSTFLQIHPKNLLLDSRQWSVQSVFFKEKWTKENVTDFKTY